MILKVRERHTNEVDIYHSYGTAQKMKKSLMENFIFCAMRASKSALSFGNEARGEDLELFYLYTHLNHVIGAFLPPLLSFSSVMATLDIFYLQKFYVEKYAHTQLRT